MPFTNCTILNPCTLSRSIWVILVQECEGRPKIFLCSSTWSKINCKRWVQKWPIKFNQRTTEVGKADLSAVTWEILRSAQYPFVKRGEILLRRQRMTVWNHYLNRKMIMAFIWHLHVKMVLISFTCSSFIYNWIKIITFELSINYLFEFSFLFLSETSKKKVILDHHRFLKIFMH